MTGVEALAILAAVAIWLVSLYFHPYGRCRRCGGSGRNAGSSARRFGTCKRCKGNGRRWRAGARTIHKVTRSAVKSWRQKRQA